MTDNGSTPPTTQTPEMPALDSKHITEQFSDVLSVLTGFRQQITMLQNHIRGLEKNVKKQMRVLHREAKKNRNKGNRKPSGFAVPTLISPELCDFMKRPHGSEVARTEVTQYIINYIKELESIGGESNNSKDCLNQHNEKNEITKPTGKVSMDWAGFEPAASTLRRWRSSELIYQPLKQKM